MYGEYGEDVVESDPELDQAILNLIDSVDPLDLFSRCVAPGIVGENYDEIKKAIVLLLVAQRDINKRTRLHMLIHGPPGTGKTEILLWLREWGALFINAEYTSAVGLAGDARGADLTPGLLAEGDGMVLALSLIHI